MGVGDSKHPILNRDGPDDQLSKRFGSVVVEPVPEIPRQRFADADYAPWHQQSAQTPRNEAST
jgi:hypothetical protein